MIDGLDKPDAPHLKQIVQIFAALGEPLHHAEHQPQIALHHPLPRGGIAGAHPGQKLPFFGLGQHRQLGRVHAAQLHFVVHPNAPGLFLFSPGVWDVQRHRMRGKNCALSRLAGKRGKILFFVRIYDMLYLRRQRRHQALCPQTQAAALYPLP